MGEPGAGGEELDDGLMGEAKSLFAVVVQRGFEQKLFLVTAVI